MMKQLRWFLPVLSFGVVTPVLADELFSMTVTVTEQGELEVPSYDVFVSGPNAEDLINNLNFEQLRVVAAQDGHSVDGDEIFNARVNFRGVLLNLNFAHFQNESGGYRLDLEVPGIKDANGQPLSRSFDDDSQTPDRGNSIRAFLDYMKTGGDDLANELAALLARESGTDPIAGNPASAQFMAVQRDFDQGFTHKVSQIWGCNVSAAGEKLMLAKAGFACLADVADGSFRMPAIEVAQLGGTQSDSPADGHYDDYYRRVQGARGENQAAIGIQYARVSATRPDVLDPTKTTQANSSVFTLPLSYTVVFDANPQRKLVFRTPLSLIKTEGATAYQAGFGLGYTHPFSEAWTLTPSVGMTVVGSEDMAAASALLSYSITSSYTFDVGGWGFNIGNMVGSYSTQKLKVGDYESDPGISNTVFTNGLLVTGPGSLLANNLVMEYFINDTRFNGDELFTDNAQEVGVNIGRISSRGEVITSYVKAGISYLKASGDNNREADALRLSLVYKY